MKLRIILAIFFVFIISWTLVEIECNGVLQIFNFWVIRKIADVVTLALLATTLDVRII
jgi:hypothetical protein